jgi:hypothetical protein
MIHSSILAAILRLLSPSHDEDGSYKTKIVEPVAVCSVDDACNSCKDQADSDRCLTCLP